MSTQRLCLLGHTFTCTPGEGGWHVHDAHDQVVATVTDPRRLTLSELAILVEHLKHRRAQARRRRERQASFGRRVREVIAAHQDDIVTVGRLSGRLYSLPHRAQFAWGKAVVRAELRGARTTAREQTSCAITA
jgi:hypothetical protein